MLIYIILMFRVFYFPDPSKAASTVDRVYKKVK